MTRENADEIIAGIKTVEYREFKEHYHRRLMDKKVMEWLREHDSLLTDEEYMYANPISPVRMIHFYDYNGTWFLDVSIKETGTLQFSAEDIRHQHELGSSEQDEGFEWFESQYIPVPERDILYYFAIDSVISTNL